MQLDEQTGLLKGGAEALMENVEAWKQWAVQQAMQEKYNDALEAYGQAEVEIAENTLKRAEAQEKVNKLQAEYDIQSKRFQEVVEKISDDRAKTAALNSEEYRALMKIGKELGDATDEYENYDQAVQDANKTMEDAQKEINGLAEVLEETTRITADSTSDMGED